MLSIHTLRSIDPYGECDFRDITFNEVIHANGVTSKESVHASHVIMNDVQVPDLPWPPDPPIHPVKELLQLYGPSMLLLHSLVPPWRAGYVNKYWWQMSLFSWKHGSVQRGSKILQPVNV